MHRCSPTIISFIFCFLFYVCPFDQYRSNHIYTVASTQRRTSYYTCRPSIKFAAFERCPSSEHWPLQSVTIGTRKVLRFRRMHPTVPVVLLARFHLPARRQTNITSFLGSRILNKHSLLSRSSIFSMRLPNYLSVASFSASAALVSPLWAWAPSYFGSTSHQQRHVFSRSARLSSTSLPVEPSSPGSPCLKKQQVEPKPSLKEKAIAEGTIISHFPGGLTALKINEDLIGDDVDSLSPFLGTTRSLLAPMAFKNSASSGDYQGKKVVFPDGTQGIVVAHRPPLVFCY